MNTAPSDHFLRVLVSSSTTRRHFKPALAILLRSSVYSRTTQCDPWRYAVRARELLALGISQNDLDWLALEGVLLHARETTKPSSELRTFEASHHADSTACSYILSGSGARRVAALLGEPFLGDVTWQARRPERRSGQGGATTGSMTGPLWDGDTRELRVGETVVKRYRVPAPNQQLILTAFQEEGWPARIDDPLPRLPALDPKRRLQSTITSLNRNQRNPAIRFHGDGTGEGIYWSSASA